jgi:hypothetical protein
MVFSLIAGLVKLPVHVLIAVLRLTKHTSGALLMLFLLDHVHLHNLILRNQYAKLHQKPYVPLYIRAADTLQVVAQQMQEGQKAILHAPNAPSS